MNQIITVLIVITFQLLDLTFGARSLVDHGAAYVFRSAAEAEALYLTANRQLYRDVGLRPGNVTLEKFDGTQAWAQAFDVFYVGNQTTAPTKLPEREQLQIIWLISNQASLNSLTLNPYSVFPLKNFVVLVPVQQKNETQRFQIRSVDLDRCVQTQGQSRPIIYAKCDFENKDQQFMTEFFYAEPIDTSAFPEASETFDVAMDHYF